MTARRAVAAFVVEDISDIENAGERMQREDASIQRLEKILSKHGRKHSSEDARPHHSRPEESVAEQPVESDASLRDFAIGTGREAVNYIYVCGMPV